MFLYRCEREQSLAMFLGVFGAYCDWFQSRHTAMEYFKDRYPGAVTCPCGTNGQYMQFSNPKQPG
jgi:hypothetical protein